MPVKLTSPRRWTNSDNLVAREAPVLGGSADGLRVMVSGRLDTFRYPDVIDLSGYDFDPESWAFVQRGSGDRPPR